MNLICSKGTRLPALAVFIGIFTTHLYAELPPAGKIDNPYHSDGKYLGCISQAGVAFADYWTQTTPENACKWDQLQYSSPSFSPQKIADVVAASSQAKARGIPFKFHTILWGRSIPNWAMANSDGNSFRERLRTYITSLPAALGSQPDYIDVVNEPFGAPIASSWGLLPRTDKLPQRLSPQQVAALTIFTFQVTRNNFPNSKLLLNEFNVLTDPIRRAEYIMLVKKLQTRGLIDGLGIQFHWFETLKPAATPTNITAALNELTTQTGLPIHISELTINGLFWNSDYSGLITGPSTSPNPEQIQLNRFSSIFPALWNHPNVKGVTLWSYNSANAFDYKKSMADKVSNIGEKGIGLTSGEGAAETEKSAMRWMRNWFKTNYALYTPTVSH